MTLTLDDIRGKLVGQVALENIDPGKAVTALLRVMAALGADESWSADTLDAVVDAVMPAWQGTELPIFYDQDDEALAFWQAIP